MIAVTTAKNITNAIPAINSNIESITFIDTPMARAKKWGYGIQSVLQSRDILINPSISLTKDNEARIDLIIKEINSNITDEPIIWNLGGGQKAHQLAIWEVFRNRKNSLDIAVYTNQSTKKNEWWQFKDDELKHQETPINATLTGIEILKTYGADKIKAEKPIFSKIQKYYNTTKKITDCMDFPEFRQYTFGINERLGLNENNKDSIKNIIQNNSNNSNLDLARKLLTLMQKDDYSIMSHDEKLVFLIENTILWFKQYWKQKFKKIPGFQKELKIIGSDFLKDQIKDIINKRITNNQKSLSDPHELGYTIPTRINNMLIQALKDRDRSFSNIKDIVTEDPLLKKLLMDKIPDFKEKLSTGDMIFHHLSQSHKFPLYFEEVLARRLIELLDKYENNSINEIYSNVTVFQDNKPIAEFDLLIVTQDGNLISLDAKTFDLEKKDLDARLYNLQKLSGEYGRFIVALPYYTQDIENALYPQELVNLPYNLQEKNIPFFVISNSRKPENHQHNAKEITVNSIESFFKQMRLIDV